MTPLTTRSLPVLAQGKQRSRYVSLTDYFNKGGSRE